jgi:signal transduction histidine kinase
LQRRRLLKRERERTQLREAELRAEAENERRKNVELLSEIGKQITASLDMDTIFHKLYDHINQLADATIFGVGIYHPEKEQIEYRLAIEKGKRYAPYSRDTRDKNQFPVWCIEHRQPVFINEASREYSRYISDYKEVAVKLEDGTLSEEPQSLIYLPLVSQDKVLGVITIQSFQKNAYTEYHLNLLQNLAAYTSIALDNADAYRRLNATLANLKSTQQQLVVQEKLASLGQLTAGIAHEIRNPLNFVNNFAALSVDLAAELREEIEKRKAKSEERGAWGEDEFTNIDEIIASLMQNAEKINHHGQRADNIVKSMMQHARGSSGQREPADINHLLDEAVNLVYHGMRANDPSFNVTIEKEYDESIGKLEVVPQDISRVFLNVINNACYATLQKALAGEKERGEGREVKGAYIANLPSPFAPTQPFAPTLSVTTKNLGDKIEIRIRDNGNGIPKDIREKIFNPFFTTKPTGQGTGLGLSISYDIIVQQHRGEIKVETEVGKFTEFVVRLPF